MERSIVLILHELGINPDSVSNVHAIFSIIPQEISTLPDPEPVIRIIDLPTSIKATVAHSPDGTPNIYINARLSYEEQRRALKHELAHIHNGDVYNDLSIQAVEGL